MRGLLFWTVGIGAITAAAVWGIPRLTGDAFQGYKPGSGPFGNEETGIQLKDVKMSIYEGGKLVTEADIDTVNVRKDRQWFDFLGVAGHSGQGKDKVDFSSDSGTYDSIAAKLRFDAGIKLQSKDFDLFAPKLTIDEKFENIQAPGPVTGKLAGGNLLAMNMKYKMQGGEMSAGPIKWQGKLPQVAQEGAPISTQRNAWDFDSKLSNRKGNMTTFTEVKATDGEQMIRAKNAEYDSKSDILVATGPAYYYSDDVNLVADKITVYRKEKKVVPDGNVRMLVKPDDQPDIAGEIPPFRPDVPENISKNQPDPPTSEETSQKKDLDEAVRSSKTIRQYPALIKATTITYWYKKGERRADITGSPECLQDFPGGRWRRAGAGKAFYDGEKETLKLESIEGKSRAWMKTSIGDNLTAVWFLISTKDGDDDVRDWDAYGLKGPIIVDDEEIPAKGGGGTTTSGGGASTGGTNTGGTTGATTAGGGATGGG